MKRIRLSMKEQEKYLTIKDLIDHHGNKKRAALKLGVSIRTINRLIIVYRNKGKAGFVHGNRNRPSAHCLTQELSSHIIHLYQSIYQDAGFNFSHFTQFLSEKHDIHVSLSSVRRILNEVGIFSPNEHRCSKKKRSIMSLKQTKPTLTDTELNVAVNHELSLQPAHPRKARCKNFGEEIQMDGSIHNWFGENKATLHLAIDNATGVIVGAYFDKQETLHGYYHCFHQILSNYGIPYQFLTDRRTVFEYERRTNKSAENDVLTQFGYACNTLGVTIETSGVSQYKGQIERANRTFQDRLVSELKMENITTIEKADQYLIETFVPNFNRRFAQDYTKYPSVIESSPGEETINLTLSVICERKFDNGSCISYKNKYYQAYNQNNQLIAFKPKTKALVIKTLNNTLYVTVDDCVYALFELEKNKKVSANFDTDDTKEKKPKQVHIPPMSHPWKRDSFIRQQQRAHQHKQFTR
ncbi:MULTISPECIES: ISNCY family transposase [Terrabacteria group]|uniref:ISNCY family transposase n=1 Tax=Bacillati TaxID=1783272 RepID=UPI001C6EC69B|nr:MULTISPECIES: ISNCY family transposase [Terrabacteria group]MBW9212811.1 ISNCY family transposase [Trueperella sp. zg.1013]